MISNKAKQLSILIILAISFLIEFPLRTTVLSILFFSQPLAHIITSVAFYVALFACFLIVLNPKITSKSVVKSICVVVVFAVFEKIVSVFLFGEIFALAYEIIRPLLIFAVIVWANYWILESKINTNKVFLSIMGAFFFLGALFNILEYIRMITTIQTMGNDYFSYLSLLTPSNSIYNILAAFSTYALTFIALIYSQSNFLNKNKE